LEKSATEQFMKNHPLMNLTLQICTRPAIHKYFLNLDQLSRLTASFIQQEYIDPLMWWKTIVECAEVLLYAVSAVFGLSKAE
jgi:hypothetical protein